MNRKQRRAAHNHGPPTGSLPAASAGDQIKQLLVDAAEGERLRKFDDAVHTYKRVLQLQAGSRGGLQQSRPRVARTRQAKGCLRVFRALARADAAAPEAIRRHMRDAGCPVAAVRRRAAQTGRRLAKAIDRKRAVWRRRARHDRGQSAVAAGDAIDPVQDIAFERLLTSVRRSLLNSRARARSGLRHGARFRLRARAAMLHQ